MKKRIKLFSTIAVLCLSLALMAFGVFSALTVTYKTTGTISYDIEDTYVEIETRIYSTSKKYDDEATLKTKSQEFETSTFTTLDTLTTTGLVEGETTHDFNKVQIKNLDQGEDYTVQESDYKDTYSSVTATEAPEDLEVALKYQTAQGEDKGVYTYFVVTKLTNKSALPLYVTIPTSGEEDEKYTAPTNSNTYKFNEAYKLLEGGVGEELYVVFAMSLDDITVPIAIEDAKFVYPIHISQDEPVTEGVEVEVSGLGKVILPIEDGQTLQQVLNNTITINDQEISEYTTCGWFSDEALLEVADLSQPAQADTVLYTKLATLDLFNSSYEEKGKYYTLEVKSDATDIVLPVKYNTSLDGDAYVKGLNTDNGNSLESIVLSTSITTFCGSYSIQNLKTLNLHSNITILEGSLDCPQLDLSLPNTLEYIGQYVIPSSVIENSAETINGFQFLKARDNTTLYMVGSEDLERVDCTIPDCAVIAVAFNPYTQKFSGTLTIPETVRGISGEAFYWHEEVDELILNEGLKHIGGSAFGYTGISTLDLPSSVTTLGKDSFVGCELETITLNSTIETQELDSFCNAGATNCTLVVGKDGDSNKITLKSNVFMDSKVTTLIVKDNVQKIENNVFFNSNMPEQYLKTIILSNGVQEIGEDAFGLDSDGNEFNITIYYTGTQTEYEALIANLTEEDSIHKATVYFYSEDEPTGEGNYWYYNNDVPTIWS